MHLEKQIKEHRKRVESARRRIVEWNEKGVRGWFQIYTYTREIDSIIRDILREVFKSVPPSYSVVALGGYGRRELNLCSDLDIMFLWRTPLTPREEESVNLIVQRLWDLGLDIGHSYRSIDEAISMAKEDDTVKCAYLDARLLGGSYNPYFVFVNRMHKEVLGRDPGVFYRIMDQWLEERYLRYGASMYLLEPNVKESPGGLRDLHTCYWLGKEIYGVVAFSDLKKKGLLTPLEYETLAEARDFLWRVRNAIHQRRGRKNDVLTIDIQPDIAYQLGYRDTRGLLGVEYFMKDFYNHVRNVRRVTKAFLLRTEEELFPGTQVFFEPLKVLMEERFDTPAQFLEEVVRLLNLGAEFDFYYRGFWVPPLHWKEQLMFSAETKEAFVELLNHPRSYYALKFLHEIGFLERLIPEFGKITGLMQFDLYHKFTVDEHTLLAIKNVEALPGQDHPMYSLLKEIYKDVVSSSKKYLLVLSLLLHDIGKGKGGGHSARGARIASQIMESLGFSEDEINLVTFIVRNHTVMAEFAFRRDVSSKRTVVSFASLVGTRKHLDMLYLVTYADVSAISPDQWNEWKAALLESLYRRTLEILTAGDGAVRGMDISSFNLLVAEVYRRLQGAVEVEEVKRFLSNIPVEDLVYLSVDVLVSVVRAMKEASREGIALSWHTYETEGITKLVVVDVRGAAHMSDVVGAITLRRLNIQSAQFIKGKDGSSIYIIDVSKLDYTPLRDEQDMVLLVSMVKDALTGKLDIDQEIRKRHVRLSRKEKAISVKTKVRLSNSIIEDYTVVEVKTKDRLGLLYHILKALKALGLEIHMARVSTEGNRAVDTFYVTRDGKKLKEQQFSEVVRALKAALE